MLKWIALALLGAVAPAAALVAPALAEALRPRPELLVSAQWLAERLAEPPDGAALRIVDLRAAGAYRAGHIPGAVHMPLQALSAPRGGVAGMLPPPAQVEAAFRRAGIGPKTVVVGYDARGGLAAARLFWALDYLGQGNGRVLDGGWPGWASGGRPVSRAVSAPVPSDFKARPQPAKLAGRQWVQDHLQDSAVAVVDARSLGEFDGTRRYSMRGGHIPGARLLDWRRHLDPARPGHLRPAGELRQAFAGLGLPATGEVVVYCQTMMRASHTYFVLKLLGYPRVRGYDGSWAEWGNRRDTPVETGRGAN